MAGRCENCSLCGERARHKVGEESGGDPSSPYMHNLTNYLCCEHFQQVIGQCCCARIDAIIGSPHSQRLAGQIDESQREAARILGEQPSRDDDQCDGNRRSDGGERT